MRMREIVFEKSFEASLKAIEEDDIRADEFINGVEWVLLRDPESGHRISGNLWFIAEETAGSAVPLCIYYTFSETQINLLAIHKAQPDRSS